MLAATAVAAVVAASRILVAATRFAAAVVAAASLAAMSAVVAAASSVLAVLASVVAFVTAAWAEVTEAAAAVAGAPFVAPKKCKYTTSGTGITRTKKKLLAFNEGKLSFKMAKYSGLEIRGSVNGRHLECCKALYG